MRYEVFVKFHKSFVEVEGNKITVGVMSKPERGRANEELVRKIARHFKVPCSRVKIRAGKTSRRKIIEITP